MHDFTKQFNELRTLEVDKLDTNLKIENIKNGSFLYLYNVLYKVVDVYNYRYKKEIWKEYKLYSIIDGTTTYIEIEIDDDVDVYLTTNTLRIKDIGINRFDLDAIVDEESTITVNNKDYYYEDDYKVHFSKVGQDETLCYLYEFASSDNEYLTIENWDGEYEVYISNKIKNKKIKVVSI